MLGTDVMKDTGHRALHPEIKALDRVVVNRATNIFAASMRHRLVRHAARDAPDAHRDGSLRERYLSGSLAVIFEQTRVGHISSRNDL